MSPVPVIAFVAVLLSSVLAGAPSAQGIRKERVSFAKGASSATIKARVTGDETVDYLVRVGAGQTLAVALKKSNPSNYLNVLPPGSVDSAMFIGQTGEDFTGVVPADGDYTLRVYLMRSAARRKESSDYTLTIGVTGQPLAPLPAQEDALLPGTRYHASAQIACVPLTYGEAKPKTCQAFVIRRGSDGTATVEIKEQTRVVRRMLFVKGKPVASDSTVALTFSRKGDVTTVKFDLGESYDVPDAFITGG